jgi:tetratricopeptide (TPR) repeat protein
MSTTPNSTCPACGRDTLKYLLRQGLFQCVNEACGERFSRPLAPPLATDDGDPGRSRLRQMILERFPFPIAFGYRATIQPDNAATAIKNLLFTYTATLRFTCLVLLSQFLRGERQDPSVARAIRRLMVPHLNDWFTVVNTLARHFSGDARAFADGGPFSLALVEAVRRVSRLAVSGGTAHEVLLRFRNHQDGHSATWTEEQCRAQLAEPLDILERVLETMSPLAEIAPKRRSARGMINLVGAGDAFVEDDAMAPSLERAFEESDVAVVGPGGAVLPLYPLFCSGDERHAQGLDEPLLAFDGHGKQRITYIGVRSRCDRHDSLARYQGLLAAKDIDPRFTKEELRPWIVAEWARETTSSVIENLRGVKYFPALYEERRGQAAANGREPVPGVDDEVARWLERAPETALVVAAEAGSGKTSLLCHVASTLLARAEDSQAGKHADCVLLILGGAVRGAGAGRLFAKIRDGLGMSDDPRAGVGGFAELLDAWTRTGRAQDVEHERRRLVFLVDAVNEAEDPKGLLEEIAALAAEAAATNRRLRRTLVRLLVSVRAERIETLLSRWARQHDSPLLHSPENFAYFTDDRGRKVPYLALRRFTDDEARGAYLRAQGASGPSSPAPWTSLPAATRALLRHPLMGMLFHGAFAGVAAPPALVAEDAVWDAWLGRTFDPRQGGALLERWALDLADACIDLGAAAISDDVASRWRGEWLASAEIGNDPIRIAAALDPLERLTEAGLLRRGRGGDYDWVSDSLAEQVFLRALRRRGPSLAERDLTEWLRLPVAERLDGALVHVGVAVWNAGRPGDLVPFAREGTDRGSRCLGAIVSKVAPRASSAEAGAVATFGQQLDTLIAAVRALSIAAALDVLEDALLWEAAPALSNRWGTNGSVRAILSRVCQLAQCRLELEPNNEGYLCDLAVAHSALAKEETPVDPARARTSLLKAIKTWDRLMVLRPNDPVPVRECAPLFERLGVIELSRDPQKARAGFTTALKLLKLVTEAHPDDLAGLDALALAYERMGDVVLRSDAFTAREWFSKALDVRTRLLELEPGDAGYLQHIGISFERMGSLEARTDTGKALEWYARSMDIARRLAEEEPDNVFHTRNLALAHVRNANLEARSDIPRALRSLTAGLEIQRRLVALQPDNVGYMRDLAAACLLMGDLETRQALPSARGWFVEALRVANRLLELYPEDADIMRQAWASYDRMGGCEGDPLEARQWFEKALEVSKRLVEREPDNVDYQVVLASAYGRMADRQATGPDEARASIEKALRISRRLSQAEPENVDFLRMLSVWSKELGELVAAEDPLEARASFETAVQILKRLLKLEPENVAYLIDLSLLYMAMGELEATSDCEASTQLFARALEAQRRIVDLQPHNPVGLHNIGVVLCKAGVAYLAEAPERLAEAIAVWSRLADLEPREVTWPRALTAAYFRNGQADAASDVRQAREWFAKAIGPSRRLVEIDPENSEYLRGLSVAYSVLGDEGLQPDPGEARRWLEEAVDSNRRLVQLDPAVGHLKLLGAALHSLAVWESRHGTADEEQRRSREFLEHAEEAAAQSGGDADLAYNLACARARCGDVARALEALRRAVEMGYSDRETVEGDPSLQSVRSAPEFGEIVARMRSDGDVA